MRLYKKILILAIYLIFLLISCKSDENTSVNNSVSGTISYTGSYRKNIHHIHSDTSKTEHYLPVPEKNNWYIKAIFDDSSINFYGTEQNPTAFSVTKNQITSIVF